MFAEHTNTFLKFIMDLFINTSEDISDILVTFSNQVVFKSDWKDAEVIFELGDKWQKSDFPSSVTIKGMKFIKLHDSPYNFVYRAIKESKALIGAQLTILSENIQVISLMAYSPNMPLISTALKDLTKSIIELGQKLDGIVSIRSNFRTNEFKFP